MNEVNPSAYIFPLRRRPRLRRLVCEGVSYIGAPEEEALTGSGGFNPDEELGRNWALLLVHKSSLSTYGSYLMHRFIKQPVRANRNVIYLFHG